MNKTVLSLMVMTTIGYQLAVALQGLEAKVLVHHTGR